MAAEPGKSVSGFVFLRHGETLANQRGVACGGDQDTEMTDAGREQIRRAAEILRSHSFSPHLIITGNLDRTAESARIMQQELNPTPRILIDSDLNERYLGDWNGQSHHIINPLMLAGKTADNGESRSDFRRRLMGSFNRQYQHFADWPLIIGSRGMARVLLEVVQDPEAAFFPNGKLLKVFMADTGNFTIKHIIRLEAC